MASAFAWGEADGQGRVMHARTRGLEGAPQVLLRLGGPLQANLGNRQVEQAPPVVRHHVHDRLVAKLRGLKLGRLPVIVPQIEVRLQASAKR